MRGSSVAVSLCYFPSHPRRIAHGFRFLYPRTYTSRSLPVITASLQQAFLSEVGSVHRSVAPSAARTTVIACYYR